ncbi:MAG: zinc-binding dehydrogenase [Alphaproteobacteria bacterium]|nr:zinc-binding dehydrogenase [Alphaproteobacteria bacterium]
MKAHVLSAGAPELREVDRPIPEAEGVLVRVRACALNRADLAMASGVKHGTAGGEGQVLGLEWSGEVVEVGAAVSSFAPGDRVMGSGAGAFAEFALSDYGRILRMPDGASFEKAACLPVALQTMHDAVVTHGHLGAEQAILINGASSGVGLMGLQIAKLKGAALVIGTSTNAERRGRLRKFGADLALDTRDPNWVNDVRKATGGEGVDVVVDQITGALTTQTMHVTRILGRIVNVGRLGGNQADFDFDTHARRRITLVGVTFRTRSKAEVREINRRMMADIGSAIMAGDLTLPISTIYDFDQLGRALEHMRANQHFGKVVLRL